MIVGGAPFLLKTQERDPFFDDVVVLLHFNGSDGSTTFTDETGKTWSAGGDAQIDTAQSKFGGASGLFDGSGDFISTASSSDFTFGTGSFTIEGWVRLPSTPGATSSILSNTVDADDTAFRVLVNTSGVIALATWNTVLCLGDTLTNNTWHYYAFTFDGTTYRSFDTNGDLVDTGTTTRNLTSSNGLNIARNPRPLSYGYINAWIDETRITKGVARYTSSFTPPSTQFPDS